MTKTLAETEKLYREIPTSNVTKAYIYLYILITYLLCLGTTIFAPVDPGYKMLLTQSNNIGLKSPFASLFFTCCFVSLFLLQYKLAAAIDKKKALFILLFTAAVYFISMPFFSGDVFLYVFKGKVQAELSLNPYEPVKYFETPYIYLSPWIFIPLAYGPFSNLVFKIFYFKNISPFLNMYILKTLFLVFFAVLTRIAYRSGSEKKFVFFVLSPFVLIEGVLCAHLDMMPLLFLILSIYFLKKENFPLTYLFLGIAAAFKINFAIFALPFFIENVRKSKRFFFDPLFFVLPILLSILIFPGIEKYPEAVKFVGSLTGVSSLKLFENSVVAKYFFVGAAGLTFIYFFYLYLGRKIDVLQFCCIFFLVFLLFDKIFQPWHILPLYAFRLYRKHEGFDYFGLVSLVGIYGVFFLFYEWNPLQNFIATIVILAGIIYTITAEYIDSKKRRYSIKKNHAG